MLPTTGLDNFQITINEAAVFEVRNAASASQVLNKFIEMLLIFQMPVY